MLIEPPVYNKNAPDLRLQITLHRRKLILPGLPKSLKPEFVEISIQADGSNPLHMVPGDPWLFYLVESPDEPKMSPLCIDSKTVIVIGSDYTPAGLIISTKNEKLPYQKNPTFGVWLYTVIEHCSKKEPFRLLPFLLVPYPEAENDDTY